MVPKHLQRDPVHRVPCRSALAARLPKEAAGVVGLCLERPSLDADLLRLLVPEHRLVLHAVLS